LQRFGIVRIKADTQTTYEVVMSATEAWNATGLAEFHVVLKRLGQTICRAERAHCQACPISLRCKTALRAAAGQRADDDAPGP
jgi:endonuclease-3